MNNWIDVYALLPGLRGIVVHAVAAADEPRVRQVLTAVDFELRVLEGARIVDETSFFEQIAQVFVLPDGFGDNWETFADTLCDLHGHIAVVWRDADRTFAGDAQVLLTALQEFASAAEEPLFVPDAERKELQLAIFLFGAGPGFHPLGA